MIFLIAETYLFILAFQCPRATIQPWCQCWWSWCLFILCPRWRNGWPYGYVFGCIFINYMFPQLFLTLRACLRCPNLLTTCKTVKVCQKTLFRQAYVADGRCIATVPRILLTGLRTTLALKVNTTLRHCSRLIRPFRRIRHNAFAKAQQLQYCSPISVTRQISGVLGHKSLPIPGLPTILCMFLFAGIRIPPLNVF